MPSFDCDLFVIGAGSAGVRAARMAAQRGAHVVVAEAAALGGTCVNVGCVPKKLYSYASHFADDFADAAGFGWEVPAPRFNWPTLKKNRATEITRLNGIYRNLLTGSGATIVSGWAQFVDAHTVQVQSSEGVETFRARNILIATGGTPVMPKLPGCELAVSSDSMFDLDPFPRRLLVVGGGYIACEFASIFNGLGAQVTQLYRGEQVLRGFDEDVRGFIAQEVRKHGVDLRVNSDVKSLSTTSGGISAALIDGTVLEVDTVLYATGRAPNVASLGLEAAGVRQREDGAVIVNSHYETNVPHIHAVGDVTARVQLTPVALAEAMVVVDRLFGKGEKAMGYEFIPTAVFTHPNIATVGYSESEACKRYGKVTVFRSEFKSLKHTLSGSTERTLMKMIVDDATDRVVGMHMVGSDAGEIIQGFAVAMKAGATKAVFDSTIGIHPTAAEEFVTMRDAWVTPQALVD
ncbi:glutathione-disulfide reductase [Caenimonas sp. SL110]|uniref:glutathione-disulfide reductase n=1 Tax=Caenimonas sp. SL110 TaxID=1450524 RepID=UPI000654A94B|nr:glutathione-disulfide reductase [Caenimonas sp. SL110]